MAKFRENRRISYVMKKSCKVVGNLDSLGCRIFQYSLQESSDDFFCALLLGFTFPSENVLFGFGMEYAVI